jgi:hypothetical protein
MRSNHASGRGVRMEFRRDIGASIHAMRPPAYQIWKPQEDVRRPTQEALRRPSHQIQHSSLLGQHGGPCLPIEPKSEDLVDLDGVELFKISNMEIIFTKDEGKT